jgi:glycine/D-amino acid oxidase-like deaminating enzyme
VYRDLPNRSPWVAQLAPDGPPLPLDSDSTADVAVVGAGIAGIASAFFVLRSGACGVLLLERGRVGRGATGHNAGQLTTYFERPLADIADEFGLGLAAEAQRGVEEAPGLLDLMVRESGASVRVERFTGHMGMFNRHHLDVHLRCLLVRKRAGLPAHSCVVSEEADFVADLAPEFAGLYSVVPQAQVRELLEVEDDRYFAVLSEPAGFSNSALLCQQVLASMRNRYPDRFRYADCTNVDRIVVDDDRIVVSRRSSQSRSRAGGAVHERVRRPCG